jgi:Zonular occludens toxin (Zot)
MSISLYEAKPGQGKSVYATYRILNALRKKNIKVCTNMDVIVPQKYSTRFTRVNDWTDIKKEIYKHMDGLGRKHGAEGTLILVLDELSILLDAQSWESLPNEVKFILRQHRKFGVNVYGFSQSVKDINAVYRRLVQHLFTIKKIFVWRWKWPVGLFFIREWDSDDVDKDKVERNPLPLMSMPFEFCLVDPWVFKAMDSWALFELRNKGLRVMEHVTHVCEDKDCKHTKIVHV